LLITWYLVSLYMQGKKIYQEKMFTNFQLSERIPKNNFYRQLQEVLELDFLYLLTRPYYGDSGQKSIDPVVFFKLSLVGYLENIISDRQLIVHSSMRLDILYFLGYDIDEPLPWHSTISRTRQLYPEKVFEQVFTKVLGMYRKRYGIRSYPSHRCSTYKSQRFYGQFRIKSTRRRIRCKRYVILVLWINLSLIEK